MDRLLYLLKRIEYTYPIAEQDVERKIDKLNPEDAP